jgi:hypothetical protein
MWTQASAQRQPPMVTIQRPPQRRSRSPWRRSSGRWRGRHRRNRRRLQGYPIQERSLTGEHVRHAAACDPWRGLLLAGTPPITRLPDAPAGTPAWHDASPHGQRLSTGPSGQDSLTIRSLSACVTVWGGRSDRGLRAIVPCRGYCSGNPPDRGEEEPHVPDGGSPPTASGQNHTVETVIEPNGLESVLAGWHSAVQYGVPAEGSWQSAGVVEARPLLPRSQTDQAHPMRRSRRRIPSRWTASWQMASSRSLVESWLYRLMLPSKG